MIKTEKWGEYKGRTVDLYELTNENGAKVRVTDYGARIVSLILPRGGKSPIDILLGFDKLAEYVKDDACFGATIGRYSNRIKGGKFELNGKSYSLTQNEGRNHLHGGYNGFDSRLWEGETINSDEGPGVKLTYVSDDGEEGYPGTLKVSVSYVLTETNDFTIETKARTDRTTILSLTNHNYYNLTGVKEDITSHELAINSEKYTPVDSDFIPTGEISQVKGTPMDLRSKRTLGKVIHRDHNQIDIGKGLNQNFVLNKESDSEDWAADLYAPSSGIRMKLYTDQPCIQCYTSGYLDDSTKGKNDQIYGPHDAICLEPQQFPDAPNQSNFPTPLLHPGEKYSSTIKLDFSRESEPPSTNNIR